MIYKPFFKTTGSMIKCLGKIEAARDIVDGLNIPLSFEQELRQAACAKMTHYSTKIEGNRLTLKQTTQLLAGREVIAREIDKREAMNYYDCLEFIFKCSQAKRQINEKLIKELHYIIQKGILKGRLRGEYRQAQNAVYDSHTGKPVYFPPEAKDISGLMNAFVRWLEHDHETHPVLKAGIAHYQLVTIHPFMDGNGRTARALTTLLLYLTKYDPKQFYSLEEYYAQDLNGYYDALHQCQGVHYYNNPNPDITVWLEYFLKGAAIIFEQVKEKALEKAQKQQPARSEKDIRLLEKIGPREKRILAYFQKNLQLKTRNLCVFFNIKERAARDLLAKWMDQGLVEKQGSGKRNAYYVLSAEYRRLIGS